MSALSAHSAAKGLIDYNDSPLKKKNKQTQNIISVPLEFEE